MKKALTHLITGAALLISSQSFATTHVITASDANFFTPDSLTIPIGDTIMFQWIDGTHTATSDNIPTGATPFDAPLDVSNPTFMYVPDVVGEYNYVCTPHLLMGMIGKFIVEDTTSTPGPRTHIITASDAGFFTPDSLTIPIGDTIMFQWIDGTHDAVSTSIPTGAASFNEPLTAANPSFIYVPAIIGLYNYICTPHESMGMIGKFIVEDTALSVKNIINNDAFSILPNPAQLSITISDRSNSGIIGISITDIQGRNVLTADGKKENSVTLDVSKLNTGMYFVSINTLYGSMVKKLVINN